MIWTRVADELDRMADTGVPLADGTPTLDAGQRAAVRTLARRIAAGGRAVLIADEVGMGKTRIAAALIKAVEAAGGRSAVVLPAGLGKQWLDELRRIDPEDATLLPLRSYESFTDGFVERRAGSDRNARRLQRDLPQGTWSEERILLISHAFAGMTFPRRDGDTARGWRRELLPAVARMVAGRRRYLTQRALSRGRADLVKATHAAAAAIAASDPPLRSEDLAGNHTRLDSAGYRDRILPLIGRALGQFELVVIDEAHKARGEDSMLSRVLGPVTWEAEDCFRLGLTATPVELDPAQWLDTLGRILGREDGADLSRLDALRPVVENYVAAVQRLQREELAEETVAAFELAAARFTTAVGALVLRRDKRDDPEIARFVARHGDYREVRDLPVTCAATDEGRVWLRKVCAAEALSVLPQDDPRVKTARLFIAKAHGEVDIRDDAGGVVREGATGRSPWLDALTGSAPDVHTHPSIAAAVRAIEEHTAKSEKVLVFARFLAPMRALTDLLNAREMLRRLRNGGHWPARGFSQTAALSVALRDPEFAALGPAAQVQARLSDDYARWASARKEELSRLRREVAAMPDGADLAALLARDGEGDLDTEVGALLQALSQQAERPDDSAWSARSLVDAYRALMEELVAGEEEADEATLQGRLARHLQDYSGRQGGFARMMSGDTAADTRRRLQAGFNRQGSAPMVLIAQSRVGSEGLNLHGACRTVFLFHAEWNPGVVEQQIGRVDRKNSRWSRDYAAWEAAGAVGGPPRILVRPVVFEGTYDAHNWAVLKERWASYRAQLHGEILTQSTPSTAANSLAERVQKAAPRLSPLVLGDV